MFLKVLNCGTNDCQSLKGILDMFRHGVPGKS
jgi:hypothetical protein